jgi:hypothetical protein
MSTSGTLHNLSALCLGCLLFLFAAVRAEGHILDELSQKTRLYFYPERIDMKMELAPGTLIAPYLLEILDPDQDGCFSEDNAIELARTVARHLIVLVDGKEKRLQEGECRICSIEDLITGVGTIYLNYTVPVENAGGELGGEHTFYYENRYEVLLSLYSLHINDNPELGLAIVCEEREEVTQSAVTVRYRTGVYQSGEDQEVSTAVEPDAGVKMPGVRAIID